jgi:hypothetical protein
MAEEIMKLRQQLEDGEDIDLDVLKHPLIKII